MRTGCLEVEGTGAVFGYYLPRRQVPASQRRGAARWVRPHHSRGRTHHRVHPRERRHTANVVIQVKARTTATKSRTLCSGPNGSGSRKDATAMTTVTAAAVR